MELASAFARYGHALGRWQAAWRFASPELRRAVALGQISAAWDVFRRDAGPGAVGRHHERQMAARMILAADDRRRDAVLLWLADHGYPAISEAAELVSCMVGAKQRFGAEELDLLQAARDALATGVPPGRIARLVPAVDEQEKALGSIRAVATAIDQLRDDTGFLESAGAEVRHELPRGHFSHYVEADPAGAWALNLALLAHGSLFGSAPPPAGLISRALFREHMSPTGLVLALSDGASETLAKANSLFEQSHSELTRGREALTHLSRNARAFDAWMLVSAVGSISRLQLARALKLSRAGADIQAHVLANAGLVTLSNGVVSWRAASKTDRSVATQDVRSVSAAVADLDATMADIDRLLAKTSR